ncbi:hypothetical protein AEAC466_12830 [Asticcacaulis sp. AC466]|uniref:serine hydrolase domain-containing protein n=1 Tax=Asticcacaulis sp. AC466 TaxID=1282362 RepID=UPI0003C412A8|nr:serine hydrolase [Asticcacaulis sp. AC466]ESQ83554.1 hypothetical protein AEAC466_12830 [Asticcacaulis sp. AC466]
MDFSRLRFAPRIKARFAGLGGCALLLAVFGLAAPAVPQATDPVAAPIQAVSANAQPSDPKPSDLKPYVPTASSAASPVTVAKKPRPHPKPATESVVRPPVVAPGDPIIYQMPSKPATPMVSPSSPRPPVIAAPGVGVPRTLPASSSIVHGVAPATSTPISPEDIETFTDSVVRTLMQRDHVLGVSVAVVQGNTPLLLKGYGYDRLSPLRRVDPNTSIFRIGSISKAFTWIVARQEIEAGRIKLDAPIAGYLPTDVFTEDRRYKPLTLRSLMDHTSGYEDTSLGHLFQLNGAHLAGPDSYFRVHKPKRVREPDEFASYSNFGAGLAARALQQTAKARDVPTLMESRIFQPLAMKHTSLREPYTIGVGNLENLPDPLSPELTRDLSDGFIWDGATYEAQPFDHAIPLAGALGASSTAQDMAQVMAVMLGNGQIDGIQLFNADSATAFRTPMLKMPEGYNGWPSGLMMRETPSGYKAYGHSGATLWFNSNMVLIPELNLGIFISTNTQTGGALAASFPNLLLDHLTGDLVRPPLMPTANNAYAQHKAYYQAIEGQYVSTRRAYGGLEGAITRLINTVTVSVDADGRLILTTQNGLSAFVPASAAGFFTQQDAEDPGPAQQTGGLHFLFNADGTQVNAFETATNVARYERIGWWHSPMTLNVMTLLMIATCIFVWLSLAKGPARHEHPTEWQSRATLISICLSVLWLAAIFVFHSWRAQLAEDPGSLFTRWPSGQVRLASGLALIASLGTIYQVATYYFVYSTRGRDGWPMWQKLAHAVLLAYWLLYVLLLTVWGALEWWSW